MSQPDTSQAQTKQSANRSKRRILLIGVPITIVFVAAFIYMLGGRYVETDNAYVQADITAITNQVSGPVKSVDVKENQKVDQGQRLYTIDPEPYQLAVDKAQEQLTQIRNTLLAQQANYQQEQTKLQQAQSQLAFNKREEARQKDVFTKHFISDADYDQAQETSRNSQFSVDQIKANLAKLKASLGGNPFMPVEQQASYKTYKSALDKALLDLKHATITAPSDGIVSHLPNVGEFATTGSTRMMLVADHNKRVDANFTEKDLTYVRPGQSVEISVDTYPDVTWQGVVESISPATGSEFSVLPAQNATGNWVKIAQRLTVRIHIKEQPNTPVLRSGMSAEVSIDTEHHRSLFGLEL